MFSLLMFALSFATMHHGSSAEPASENIEALIETIDDDQSYAKLLTYVNRIQNNSAEQKHITRLLRQRLQILSLNSPLAKIIGVWGPGVGIFAVGLAWLGDAIDATIQPNLLPPAHIRTSPAIESQRAWDDARAISRALRLKYRWSRFAKATGIAFGIWCSLMGAYIGYTWVNNLYMKIERLDTLLTRIAQNDAQQ